MRFRLPRSVPLAAAVAFAAFGCEVSTLGPLESYRDAGAGADSGVPLDAAVAPGDAGGVPDGGAVVVDAGPVATGCPGIFCEDFESGSFDKSVWTRTQVDPGNTATVQSAKVAHGRYAAQFHAKGGTNLATVVAEKLPASLATHYFGRMSFFITDFPKENGGHTAYIWSSKDTASFPYTDHHFEVGSYYSNNVPNWQLTYWTGDGPEYPAAGGVIPKNAWACIEWEFNDKPDALAVWVNGKSAPDGFEFRNVNNNSSGLIGAMTTLGIEFRTFHPNGAPDIDVFADDIVLDTKRVGCP